MNYRKSYFNFAVPEFFVSLHYEPVITQHEN